MYMLAPVTLKIADAAEDSQATVCCYECVGRDNLRRKAIMRYGV